MALGGIRIFIEREAVFKNEFKGDFLIPDNLQLLRMFERIRNNCCVEAFSDRLHGERVDLFFYSVSFDEIERLISSRGSGQACYTQ